MAGGIMISAGYECPVWILNVIFQPCPEFCDEHLHTQHTTAVPNCRHLKKFSSFTGLKMHSWNLFRISNMTTLSSFIGPPIFFIGLPTFSSVMDQGRAIIKWKHFPYYWPFVRGIHRSPVNSPHKGQWCGAFMFSLNCAWTNGWVNNRNAGDLRRNHAHYDVNVMTESETGVIICLRNKAGHYHTKWESW